MTDYCNVLLQTTNNYLQLQLQHKILQYSNALMQNQKKTNYLFIHLSSWKSSTIKYLFLTKHNKPV